MEHNQNKIPKVTEMNNVSPSNVSSLNNSPIRPSSVKRITVVQAINSNRIGPSEDPVNYNEKDSDKYLSTDKNSSANIEVQLHSGSVYDKNPLNPLLYGILGISGVFVGVLWASAYFLVP